MAKYMLLYRGPATPMEQMTAEQRQQVQARWKVWMENVGSALLEVGAPMANGQAVVDDGRAGSATQLNGYSIVEASDMDSAKQLCDGHPFLSDKTGQFSIEVHELLPTPV